MSHRLGNPYVGPRTFDAADGDRFFGREREARDLLALVVSNRLVLFYAQSGAGKSSLIRTRLIPRLTEDEGFIALPVGRVKGELPPGITEVDNIFLFNLYLSLVGDSLSDPGWFVNTGELTLTRFLANLVTSDGQHYDYEDAPAVDEEADAQFQAPPHVLVIDQFEDLVTTHRDRWQDRESFFDQLGKAMAADPRLWVVLALREDSVAALDPYAHLVPGRLASRFYMQRLERAAALDAVRKPARLAGRPFAPGVAEKLVDDLRQIRVHGMESPGPGQYIEPVQLQVVCYQLWENLQARPGPEITHEDLQQAGDIDTAMASFYEQAVHSVVLKTAESEYPLRNWFEERLITEAGTRGAVFRGSEQSDGIDTRAADALVEEFILRTENRAGGIWFELVHDRFIEPVRQANRAWREEQQQDAGHLGEMLQLVLLEEGKLAQDILVMMASPGIGTWVSSGELLLESIRPILAEHGQDALEFNIALSGILTAVPQVLEALKGQDPLQDLMQKLRELVRPYSIEDVAYVLERLVHRDLITAIWKGALSPYASGDLPRTLERLVHAGVLIRRPTTGQPTYAFANQVVAERARTLYKERDWRRYHYQEELQRTWATWLARDALATRSQLRFLAEGSMLSAPQPVVALLLLRSAVARDQPTKPWLDHLQTEEGRRLLRQVNDPDGAGAGPAAPSVQAQAAKLLGLKHSAPDSPTHPDGPPGQIILSALLNPDLAIRQTAALALTVIESNPESLLEQVLQLFGGSARRRRSRLFPLWGILLEADAGVAERFRHAAPADRFGVWRWQLQRQILRDRMYIFGLTLGGAMGSGLCLGLLKAFQAAFGLILEYPVAVSFSSYYFWGAFLGAALSLGMALGKPLLLTGLPLKPAPSIDAASRRWRYLVANMAGILGSLFFGFAYLAVVLINGLRLVEGYPWLYAAGLGLVLGLGLSLALYGQPQAGLGLGFGRWLLRLSTAALFFATSQFLSVSTMGAGLVITWSGVPSEFGMLGMLKTIGETVSETIGQELPFVGPTIMLYKVVAVVDACLVGIVLTIGLASGMALAARWVARWYEALEGLSD